MGSRHPGPPLAADTGLQSQPGILGSAPRPSVRKKRLAQPAVTHTSKGTTVNARETRNDGDVVTSYKHAQTRTVTADGVTFAYRDLGPRTGMPVIFITHLAAVLGQEREPADASSSHGGCDGPRAFPPL